MTDPPKPAAWGRIIDGEAVTVSAYPLPCPICNSDNVCSFEQVDGLFIVSCENDDCVFNVEVCGSSAKEAIDRWNTRDVAQASRDAVIEECVRCLEALGARYHSGRDLVAHLRACALPSTEP